MTALPQQPGVTQRDPARDSTSHHRCDSAHHSRAPSSGDNAVPTGIPETELLQRQTRQIEEHLQQRLSDLDRREAQIHASCAQLESNLRNARMWWLNHQGELQVGEQLPAPGAAHPADQNIPRKVQTPVPEQPLEPVEHRQTDLNALRINLGFGDAPWLKGKQGYASPHSPTESRREKHESTLRATLKTLKQSADQLRADQQAFADEREAWRQERRAREENLKQREQELEEKTTRIAQRLWQRRSRLSRMNKIAADWHETAVQRHRESLELRLVAEQLFHDLKATVPTGQLRDKRQAAHRQLEQHYHDRETASQQRQVTLNQQIAQLHRQQAELATQRAAILQEAEQQRRKLAQLTARLVERQRQLDQREQMLLQQRHTWQNEQYQQLQTLDQLLQGHAYETTLPPNSGHSQ